MGWLALRVPPLVELPLLIAAAQGFIDDPGNVEALRILLAPGSSLGGARPKASVVAGDGRGGAEKALGPDDRHSGNARDRLAAVYDAWGKTDLAAEMRAR